MNNQNTSHILMIRPAHFTYNEQTAVNNAFQVAGQQEAAQEKAVQEFDNFVQLLRDNDVDVTVVNDTKEPHTPDSIFPNNWISFHESGKLFLYPMYAENRRKERKQHVLDELNKKFKFSKTIDLTHFEKDNKFLEGTGSMVLDREFKIAYACLSPRTDKKVVMQFAKESGYEPVLFHATDAKGQPIYHTNVMMCVADYYVVVCLESIKSVAEKSEVIATINGTEKEVVIITLDQTAHFAGNMLQVENTKGEKLLIMSTQAYNSLTTDQLDALENYNRIIHADLNTIETNGGGSARCMLAEIFAPAQ